MAKQIAATAFLSYGDNRTDTVSRVVCQIENTDALVASMVPKARVRGLADTELVEIPYVDRNTGLTVDAGTAITGEGLYEWDSTGVETGLDVTYTSGAGKAHFVGVAG